MNENGAGFWPGFLIVLSNTKPFQSFPRQRDIELGPQR